MTVEELAAYQSARTAFICSPEGRQMAREKAKETADRLEWTKRFDARLKRRFAAMPDTAFNRLCLEIGLEVSRQYLEGFGWDRSSLESELRRWMRLAKEPAKGSLQGEERLRKAKAVPIEEAYGFENLRRNGDRSTARCPFHLEKTASFTIFHADNHAHCYGCSWHGDVIDFRKKLFDESFNEAVKALI